MLSGLRAKSLRTESFFKGKIVTKTHIRDPSTGLTFLLESNKDPISACGLGIDS
jgi:hypothetical protein